jgi:hypothetical protein
MRSAHLESLLKPVILTDRDDHQKAVAENRPDPLNSVDGVNFTQKLYRYGRFHSFSLLSKLSIAWAVNIDPPFFNSVGAVNVREAVRPGSRLAL